MPKITSLEPQRRKDRLNVYVDGAFFCGVSLDTLVRFGIVVEKEYTDEELGLLLAESGENELYLKALAYIVKSPRTEHEITRFLYKKDASPETVAKINERLKTMNYINDEAYAKLFTEQKMEKLGIGSIRNKLYTRGIDAKLIEQALDQGDEPESQEELSKRVAEKYMRNRTRDPKTLQKLYRHLASRGFDFDLCARIVDELKKETELDENILTEYQDKWAEYKRAKAEMRERKQQLRELKKQILIHEE